MKILVSVKLQWVRPSFYQGFDKRVCAANQLTGFYMSATLAIIGLNVCELFLFFSVY